MSAASDSAANAVAAMSACPRAFLLAVAFVLGAEGGLHTDPDDPGGTTNFGFAQRYNRDIDVSTLTRETASERYFHKYWQRQKCGAMPAPLAVVLFDTSVNLGTHETRLILQAVLGVKVDGVLGPKTLAAAAASGDREREDFLARRAIRYANDTQFDEYGHGWLRRCFAVADLAARIKP